MKSFTWEYVNGSLSVEYDVFWGHSDFGRNITQNEWVWTTLFVTVLDLE